ncbi:unnamed protein product [Lepeophtheirus salmonis]|uniref:(salmon louse) hypothetical protein n=1 Tax=Lepeophtheirus salmonis TaxID=72036 RepID=A0A7R8CX94_LEPSM|nr:unnamed protein product [Lepeophtheirus salmonis]CAF2958466.1 unnamed protein product [Lepeophtheirus salmonis]
MLKVTQTKGLIAPEGGSYRFSVVGELVQGSDEGETNGTDPGKQAITATSESVLTPLQGLKGAEEYSTGFTEDLSKKDSDNSESVEVAGRRRHHPGYYKIHSKGKF